MTVRQFSTSLSNLQQHILHTLLTCAGKGHTTVLFLGWRAFIGTSGGNGEGRGGRKGTAVIIQLPARWHHHAIVEGKQWKLCWGGRQRDLKVKPLLLLWNCSANLKTVHIFWQLLQHIHSLLVPHWLCDCLHKVLLKYSLALYVYCQTILLTIGGQQRAKTDPAQCVLQLVPVTVYTPLCLPGCLPPSFPPFLPAFLRSAGGGIEEHAHRC